MSARQTKTALDALDAQLASLDAHQFAALDRGAKHFNRGKFFAAHEDWELRWRKLPLPDRPQVQAGILVCGVFVLLEKGRLAPAGRLARLAIERFAEAATAAQMFGRAPALVLPEAEDRLMRVLARMTLGEFDPGLLISESKGLRAVVNGLS